MTGPAKRVSFLKNEKVIQIISASFVFFCTLLFFYLDAFVGGKVSFYIFYFPSIAAMAWYFGRVAGWSTVVLCTTLWFVKQWDLAIDEIRALVFWNGIICSTSFCTICWMTLKIRDGQIRLRERSQELEEFAFRAAHELKSPTANILGYTELLEGHFSQGEDPKAKGFVENILKNLQRMTAMIKDLLDYARGGKRESDVLPVDLEKVLKETLESFSLAIAEKKAEVLADPLPTVAIQPGLAGLLFQNLISNALKYCERPPRIHISAAHRGSEWVFSVTDNGIGIPDEDRERVFLLFEKLPTTHQYSGSGVGLATCRKIITNYGGRIWVESKLGEGSTFFFTLPAK